MKKGLPILLMALLSFSSLTPADDSDWKPVVSSQGKYKLFLNAKTLQREDDVVNVTMRYVFAEQQIFPFINIKYNRMERNFAFQCKERNSVALENHYYLDENQVHTINLAAGNPFQPKEQMLIPKKVEPDSMEDEALKRSCDYSDKEPDSTDFQLI